MARGNGGSSKVRLVAIDDHEIVLRGVLAALTAEAEWIEVAGAYPSVEAYEQGGGHGADVVLLDLHLGDGADPAESVHRIVRGGARVLIFTADIRPVPARRAIKAGAIGLALKSDPVEGLLSAIAMASRGEPAVSGAFAHLMVTDPDAAAHLTPRELEVLRWLAQGLPHKSIASRLNPPVDIETVRDHINRVAQRYRDLGRPTQGSQAALRQAARDGHLDLT